MMESARVDEGSVSASEMTGAVGYREVEPVPLRTLLQSVRRPRVAWVDETSTIATGGAAATIAANGQDRFETVRTAATTLFEELHRPDALPREARPRLFGGFAFHENHSRPGPDATWHGYPGALFVLPAIQLAVGDDAAWLTATATGPRAIDRVERRLDTWQARLSSLPELALSVPPGIDCKHPTPSRDGWRDQVTSAIARINRSDLRKVVLAQSLSLALERPVDGPDAITRLGRTYPDCFRFLFEPAAGGSFFGATPERLVSLRGRAVETEALAGSIGRGDTDDDDDRLASTLRNSAKEVQEHELVVEAIRDQLESLAKDVRADSRTIRRLATVQHLQTPIRAELLGDEHVLSLVEALHPTPAVGGFPPDAALETICETEAFSRGWYAAPVGWIDEHGDGTFAVAIRSALASGETATLFAGAGIVPDSDPDEEWDELQLKYGPMIDELA